MTTRDNSDNRIIANIGPLRIDVPQSRGDLRGVAAAFTFGVLGPPVAVFIAAVLKMLANSAAPQPIRFVGEILQGAAKPLGSYGEGTVQLPEPERAWRDVQQLAQPRQAQPAHRQPVQSVAGSA